MSAQKQETTDLVELDAKLDRAIALMEQAGGRIGRVVAIANATKVVRDLVVANWDSFKELKNSKLGWSTDERDEKKYSDQQLQTALTQAILKGGLPVNMEIGVISGGAYLQKPYFERQLREREDISDVRVTLDVPETVNGRTVVGGVVTWKRNGTDDRVVCRKTAEGDQRIPVRVNAGMGDDAVLGKATRKILARMLTRIDGSQAWEDLAAEGGVIDSTAERVVEPEKKPPTVAQLREAFAKARKEISSATTAEALDLAVATWHGPESEWHGRWPEKGEVDLVNLICEKRKSLTKSEAFEADPQFAEWAQFEADLAHCEEPPSVRRLEQDALKGPLAKSGAGLAAIGEKCNARVAELTSGK